MGERAATLASQFERVNGEVIVAVEGFSGDQWATLVPGENWTVGVVAHHVADGHRLIAGWLRALIDGQALQPPLEQIHDLNAAHAERYAACTKAETLELLRSNGEEAARLVRGLSDEQLAKTAPFRGEQWTADNMIERVLVVHPQRHLTNIRETLSEA